MRVKTTDITKLGDEVAFALGWQCKDVYIGYLPDDAPEHPALKTQLWYPPNSNQPLMYWGICTTTGLRPRWEVDPTAIRIVEDEIERRGLQERYALALADVVTTGSSIVDDMTLLHEEGEIMLLWQLLRATPEQRCRAALRAIKES